MTRPRALLWALIALIVGAATYYLAVGNSFGQQAENEVLGASDFTVDPPAPLSLVSNLSVVIALGVIAAIALIVHGVLRTLSILFASVLALISSQILKESWLERPELVDFVTPNSFPSGHMTVFAVIAAGLIWAMSRKWRVLMIVAASSLMSFVSWQLLEYGWHRPSDIIGAYALTLCSFAIMSALGPRNTKTNDRAGYGEVNRMFAIVFTMIAFVITLGGIALIFGAISLSNDALSLNAWGVTLVGLSMLTARTFAKICP